MSGSSGKERKGNKRAQDASLSADAPGTSAAVSSGGGTSKRTAVSLSAAAGTEGGGAGPGEAGLEEGLDDLHFEDDFEDEFDDEEEYLKRIVKKKELKKRRAREAAARAAEGKEGRMESDEALDDDDAEEEEEYNDSDDGEDGDDLDDDGIEEKVGAADHTVQQRAADDQPSVDVERHERQQKADSNKASKQTNKRVWRPADGVSAEEQLEFDTTAYFALHRLKVEWPCLSFDIIPDSLGAQRRRYPHTVYMVGGTQADARNKNKLQVMKIRDLHKTRHDDSDDDEEEEEGEDGEHGEGGKSAEAKDGEDEVEEESDDEGLDIDPIVDERSIPHVGAVNRVKVNPLCPHQIATMSDTGKAHIFDVSSQLRALDLNTTAAPSTTAAAKQPATGPLFTFSGHAEEGYAIAWSALTAGRLVSGDCAKGLYLWEPKEGGSSWSVSPSGFKGHSGSVEDVCWSPGEATVFASASSDRTVRMWDVRMRDKCAAWVAAHKTDVNVISWNALRQHLLASAADDGSFKVWDLRQFKSHTPAATFTYHTQPVTSIEWHPTEDSILAASSEDNSITVWDLSLETDQEELDRYSRGAQLQSDTPPQLFFVHAGQTHIKELHWHRQIPGMFVSTAQDGFNIAHPENL